MATLTLAIAAFIAAPALAHHGFKQVTQKHATPRPLPTDTVTPY